MKVRVLRSTLEDLASARKFYEHQAKEAGNYFPDTLTQFGFLRLLVRKFPYAVYYRVISDEAVVFRVLDCRRDLKWLRNVLGGNPTPTLEA